MISLSFHNGVSLVYNVDDWYTLRTNFRIVGEFFGATGTTIALPLALSPEETYLIVKKDVAKLVKWEKITKAPSDVDKLKYEEERKQLYNEEKVVFKDERKKQIENYIDKIITGKKRKGQKDVSRDHVLQEELKKLPELEEENMVTQLCTQHPEYLRGTSSELEISEIFKYTTKVKCAVYEDLWKKGYYITTGRKFGGDFLVYLGDPVAFHAIYIVRCVENNEKEQNVSEVVAYGRLGNSVKKKSVLASLKPDGSILYMTLSWMDT